ncbi:hypothetical protein AUK40_05360 [Candidatus Wirthbacteria bacterium CG2_30_54_11]|uniref:N-acetyltransferase domain-containing protein n=1 Tax=Candidatus Wirthbacteria bacterium CG2_30_54_11 TaxID=1817892 RepID=A0A1J5INR8_9BACT|nr:MAG: hypothetical protein AUK40_05360 [Candidatus Wirthbacteria bacterium CG2_30_54_11]
MAAEYTIRNMQRCEFDLAVAWAREQGWLQGPYDADCYWQVDPHGFFVGVLYGEIIAVISAVRYDSSYGFMGYYVVKSEFRDRGYGIQLFNHAMAYLGDRIIGGDGVLERVEDYRRQGFVPVYQNARYSTKSQLFDASGEGLRELSTIPAASLLAYDDVHVPAPRHQLLRCLMGQIESRSFGIQENNAVTGYGIIRKCDTGFRIGPLIADTAESAERIYRALAGSIPAGTTVFFDTPLINQNAVDIAQRYGMEHVFSTARIYAHGAPRLPMDHIYSLIGFELG